MNLNLTFRNSAGAVIPAAPAFSFSEIRNAEKTDISFSSTMQTTSSRLASLDILRGLTLFLLVFFQPVLWALLSPVDADWSRAVLHHFDHEVWEGFRFWDLVMPLFLFMSGASMPFSFGKMLREGGKMAVVRKVIRRFFILFLLGMVVQGNLLGLDLAHIYIYTNTLQAIAAGYLLTALVMLFFDKKGRWAALVVLLLAYSLPMMWCGDFSLEGNLASRMDAAVLGRFQGDPTYAWLLPSFTFGVTVLLGALAGDRRRVSLRLLSFGLLLVVLGLGFSFAMPIVKRIWTASMALYSGGLCMLLLAAFYEVIDVRGHHRAVDWLKIYGMNSIAAYMLGEVINFRSVVDSVSYGLAPRLGDYYPAWLTFGNFALVFLILWCMYRSKVFLKV